MSTIRVVNSGPDTIKVTVNETPKVNVSVPDNSVISIEPGITSAERNKLAGIEAGATTDQVLTGGTNINVSESSGDYTINLDNSIDLSGTLDVSGNATLDSDLTVAGDITVSDDLGAIFQTQSAADNINVGAQTVKFPGSFGVNISSTASGAGAVLKSNSGTVALDGNSVTLTMDGGTSRKTKVYDGNSQFTQDRFVIEGLGTTTLYQASTSDSGAKLFEIKAAGTTPFALEHVQIGPDSGGYKLPPADGSSDTFLQTDGSGNISFEHIQTITEAVKNVSGGPLDKGTPLHITGSTGNTVEVIAADATTNYPAHLILNESLANEAEGRAVALGFINNVDVPNASIYSEGQTVYLGASGGWVTTKPGGTAAIQNLGVIVKVNTSGNKISGVVLGAGRANDVPNLPDGKFFIGSSTYTTESAYTLPTADGAPNTFLQTDGSGAVTFVAPTLSDLSDSSNVVTLSGTQTITGVKLFSSGLLSTNGMTVSGATLIANSGLSVSGTTQLGVAAASSLSVNAINFTPLGPTISTIQGDGSADDLQILSDGNVVVKLDQDNDETNQKFSIVNSADAVRFSVDEDGTVTVNSAFSFPTSDGTTGQVMTTNGSGTLSWSSPVASIEDLSDVNIIGTPSQGDVLTYNSGSGQWMKSSNLQNLLGIIKSSSGTQVYNTSLDTSAGYVDLQSTSAKMGLGGTFLTASQTSPGVLTFSVATGASGTETQFDAFTLTGTTTTDVADLLLEPGCNFKIEATSGGDAQIRNYPSNTADTTITLPQSSGTLATTADVPTSIDDLSDVDTSTVAPTDGQALVWDNANSKWEPGTVSGGSSPWTTSGSDIYYTTGNVGVGTTTPSEALDVVGKISLQGANNSAIIGRIAGNTHGTRATALGDTALYNNNGFGAIGVGFQANSYANKGNSIAIGYQSAGSLSGVSLGYQAGVSTSDYSISIGQNANNNTTGSNNVAVGYQSLTGSATSTFSNTVAVGYEALKALTTGGSNTALGDRTSRAITSGSGNTSVGILGLSNVTTTSNNTSVGAQALQLTTGSNNTAVGFQSGNSITTNGENALFGYASGIFNTGAQNVAIGSRAMYGSAGTSTAGSTVAVGYQALTALTTGTGNTAVGYQADNLTTDGTNNTTVGYQATTNGTSVNNATAVGYDAIASNTSVAIGSSSRASSTTGGSVAIGNLAAANTYDTVAIGYNSGPRAGGNPSGSVFIGNNAGNSAGGNGLGQRVVIGAGACSTNGGGRYSIYIGQQAGRFGNQNNNSSNVMIGANAAYQHNSTTSSVGIGHNAMNGADTTGSVAVGWGANAGDADYNIMIGYQAGNNSMTGGNNTMMGYQSGLALTTSANTVAVGYQALTALTTGTQNTAVGYQAGAALTTGGNNTYLGYLAGDTKTTSGNTAIGSEALQSGTSSNAIAVGYRAGELGMGSYDIAIGWYAGAGTSAGGSNIKIGETAGRFHTGNKSIIIGGSAVLSGANSNIVVVGDQANAGANTVTVGRQAGNGSSDSSVFLGYQAGSSETNNNRLYIENSNSATPLIYGEFDNDVLRVNGSFEVTGGVTADDGGLTVAGDYGKGAEIWYQGASTPTAGSVYYLDSSGNWANTDASAVATAKGMIAVSTGTDSDVDGMVIKGFVYVGTDPGGSVGDVVYLSETANQLTTTAPTTASAVVRVCGYKVGTNIVYFDPSKDWIELS